MMFNDDYNDVHHANNDDEDDDVHRANDARSQSWRLRECSPCRRLSSPTPLSHLTCPILLVLSYFSCLTCPI